MARNRMLSVLVSELSIADGQTPPPVVGEVGEFRLMFSEVADGGVDATTATFQARALPQGDGSPLVGRIRDGGTVTYRPPMWALMLHGDGWTALWSAPRPVLGEVELTGCLVGDISDGPMGYVRGRVTRARVVTETVETTDADPVGWRRVPGGQSLRDVAISPRWFAHGTADPVDRPTTGVFSPVLKNPVCTRRGCWSTLISTMCRPSPNDRRWLLGDRASRWRGARRRSAAQSSGPR